MADVATGNRQVTNILLSSGLYAVPNPIGSGYSVASFTTTGGTGTNLAGTITSVDGSGGIKTFVVTNPGSGYTSGDLLTVVQGGGSGGKIGLNPLGAGNFVPSNGVIIGVSTANPGQTFSVGQVNKNQRFSYVNTGTGTGTLVIEGTDGEFDYQGNEVWYVLQYSKVADNTATANSPRATVVAAYAIAADTTGTFTLNDSYSMIRANLKTAVGTPNIIVRAYAVPI